MLPLDCGLLELFGVEDELLEFGVDELSGEVVLLDPFGFEELELLLPIEPVDDCDCEDCPEVDGVELELLLDDVSGFVEEPDCDCVPVVLCEEEDVDWSLLLCGVVACAINCGGVLVEFPLFGLVVELLSGFAGGLLVSGLEGEVLLGFEVLDPALLPMEPLEPADG